MNVIIQPLEKGRLFVVEAHSVRKAGARSMIYAARCLHLHRTPEMAEQCRARLRKMPAGERSDFLSTAKPLRVRQMV